LLSIEAHLIESREELNLYLCAIVNEYSCDIPFVNVCCDDHDVCVWEGYMFDVDFDKGYRSMRPFDLHDWALDCHMIDLAVVLSFLSLVLEI
jgi:hypothetical protein